MAKKEESKLGLAPTTSASSLAEQGHQATLSLVQPQNREEKWIQDEFRKQIIVMKGIEVEAAYGMTLMARIQKHGVDVFAETLSSMYSVKDEQRPKEEQVYMDEYVERSLQMLAGHIFGTVEVASVNIGAEVHRSLYPPPLPEPNPPGFFKRLFG